MKVLFKHLRSFLLAAAFMLTGCVTSQTVYSGHPKQMNAHFHYGQVAQQVVETSASGEVSAERQVAQAATAEEGAYPQVPATLSVLQIAGLQKVRAKRIPLVYNGAVEKWVHYFAVKDRERFQRFMDRGEPYRIYIEEILRQRGLPTELYHLAMIESGFRNHAKSHASAVGMWQFMKGTAKDYSLRVNSYLDERKDPLKATYAAGRFLRDLYNSLESWNLAIAAYNCGLTRVRRAVKKNRGKNYWSMLENELLPKETSNYVPKFMAAVIIGQNPEKFGFRSPRGKVIPIDQVRVPGGVSFRSISKVTGVSVATLKKHNPHIRRQLTPPYKRHYDIWVPVANKGRVSDSFAKLSKLKEKPKRIIAAKTHKVRRGENLGSIARKHRVSIAKLKKLNGLKSSRINYGQRLTIRASRAVAYKKSSKKRHKVRRGENLSTIAKKYGLSVRALKSKNRIKGSRLLVGQYLKLPSKARRVAKTSKSPKKYRVKRGDNLSKIAGVFGSSVRRLKRLNGLKSARIRVGQTLVLR